jgi:hypothetical protein
MRRFVGAVVLLAAAIAGAIGVLWVGFDAIGTEWDYCPDGRDCIAGWKMGFGFIVASAALGLAASGLLRSSRRHDVR